MKKEPKFRRQFDSSYNGSPHRNEPGESKTVPDLGLTVRQLMTNHTRGIGSDAINREPKYYGDLEVPPVKDFTDLEKNRNELKEKEENLKKQIADEKEAKKPKPKPKPQEVVVVEKKTQYTTDDPKPNDQ